MAAIYQGLEWLGLNWDEGPHVDGDLGPYLQSKRTELYERYMNKLQDAGHIFEDEGAMRFRSPREHVVVDDLIHGKIDFDLSNEETVAGELAMRREPEACRVDSRTRRDAAAIRPYPAHPEPRRIKDEQAR